MSGSGGVAAKRKMMADMIWPEGKSQEADADPNPAMGGFDGDFTPGAADRGAMVGKAAYDFSGIPMITGGAKNAYDGAAAGDYTKAGLGAGEAVLGGAMAAPFIGGPIRATGAIGRAAMDVAGPAAAKLFSSVPRAVGTTAATVAVPTMADAADGTERSSYAKTASDIIASGADKLSKVPGELARMMGADERFKKPTLDQYRTDHPLPAQPSPADARAKAEKAATDQAQSLFTDEQPKRRAGYVKDKGDQAFSDASNAAPLDPRQGYDDAMKSIDELKAAEDKKSFAERNPGIATALPLAGMAATVALAHKANSRLNANGNAILAEGKAAKSAGNASDLADAGSEAQSWIGSETAKRVGIAATAPLLTVTGRTLGDVVDAYGLPRGQGDQVGPDGKITAGPQRAAEDRFSDIGGYVKSLVPGYLEGLAIEAPFAMKSSVMSPRDKLKTYADLINPAARPGSGTELVAARMKADNAANLSVQDGLTKFNKASADRESSALQNQNDVAKFRQGLTGENQDSAAKRQIDSVKQQNDGVTLGLEQEAQRRLGAETDGPHAPGGTNLHQTGESERAGDPVKLWDQSSNRYQLLPPELSQNPSHAPDLTTMRQDQTKALTRPDQPGSFEENQGLSDQLGQLIDHLQAQASHGNAQAMQRLQNLEETHAAARAGDLVESMRMRDVLKTVHEAQNGNQQAIAELSSKIDSLGQGGGGSPGPTSGSGNGGAVTTGSKRKVPQNLDGVINDPTYGQKIQNSASTIAQNYITGQMTAGRKLTDLTREEVAQAVASGGGKIGASTQGERQQLFNRHLIEQGYDPHTISAADAQAEMAKLNAMPGVGNKRGDGNRMLGIGGAAGAAGAGAAAYGTSPDDAQAQPYDSVADRRLALARAIMAGQR